MKLTENNQPSAEEVNLILPAYDICCADYFVSDIFFFHFFIYQTGFTGLTGFCFEILMSSMKGSLQPFGLFSNFSLILFNTSPTDVSVDSNTSLPMCLWCGVEKSKYPANDLHCPNDRSDSQRYLTNDRNTFSLCFQKHILLQRALSHS